VFTLQLGALGATVMFSHPEAVQTIFRAPPHSFECQHFNESYRFVMGDHALFLQDGARHRQLKRVMTPRLSQDAVARDAHDIRNITRRMIQDWSNGQSLPVRALMHELALRVLMKMVFGTREAAGELVVHWFKSEVWRDCRAWKPWTSLSRLQPRIRELISSELRQRRESGEANDQTDLLSGLLSARYEDGQPLGEDELQDQILTLMITAVDPVGFALTWLLSWVSKSSEVQARLREELSGLSENPDPRDVTQLPYLTATCQETLRIHPILPTVSGRRLTAPLDIGGYRLDAGVTVAPCAYLVHRRADLYPEPHAFRPERFLGRQFSPYEYFPFGGSNRHCLGRALAPTEMKLVLATILSRWRLALADSGPADDVRYGTLVGPPEGLRIAIESLLPGSCATLVELARRRADQLPEQLAYTFLDDGGREGERLSYGELDLHARAIAGWLQQVVRPGERALLLFPAGLDFLKAFLGCLYAGVIAIPVPPPEASRLKRTLPRLQAIAKDAEVSLMISNTSILTLMAASSSAIPELEAIKYLDIEKIPPGSADSWQEPRIASDDLAYLQYTSGSTTSPKGVMISHRNVVTHCRYLQNVCEYTPESISVTWLPYFHDYGLVEGLLEPLYNGTPCYVMSPFAFLKRPFNWLHAISRYRATHTQAPNFAYAQCIRRVSPEQRALLDLSSLRSAGNGAEPINPNVLEGFYSTFAPCGFRWEAFCPAYGLAEATLMVSCCSPSISPRIGSFQAEALAENRVVEVSGEHGGARKVTSCGRVVGRMKVVVVDPNTSTGCAPDTVGEIWLSDPSVARGYWRRDDETEQTFGAVLADSTEGPFLRTGDLGFIRDGELFITSRIKDLIIIAGANHYPQDIEWTVEKCHPDLRPGGVAAFSIQVDGEERLVIASEVERGSIRAPEDTRAIFDSIRKAVSQEHELPVSAVVIVSRGSLPKTASGKIQRHDCFRLLEAGRSDVLASWITDSMRHSQPQPVN